MGRKGVSFLEDGREWKLVCLLYADGLVLSGESEEDLRVMVGWFAEMCRGIELKVSAGKSTVMVLNEEKGSKSEVHVVGIWAVFWMNQVQMEQNVVER